MTATTVTQAFANATVSKKQVVDFVRRQKMIPSSNPFGVLIPFRFISATVATTSLDEADDIVEYLTFPKDSRLWALKVTVPAALESGTPASETDFLVGSTVVINDSQVFRANNNVDGMPAQFQGIDCSELKLSHKVVTPGDTEVAGKVHFYGIISVGFGADSEFLSFGNLS